MNGFDWESALFGTFFGAITMMGVLGWAASNRELEINVAAQKACGTDSAIHSFVKHQKTLTVCERAGGLVVVEVK
jgi:hypothetical protein